MQASACSLRTFARHQQTVMSVDFHPTNDDVVCSCDSDGEVRVWSIDKGMCTRVFKVSLRRVRTSNLDEMIGFSFQAPQCRFSLRRVQ
jgi:WD40 repeat protein